MVEDTFSFIIHPIDPRGDVGRHYPLLGKVLSEGMVHFLCTFWPPVLVSEITGVRSVATGKEIKGWFIAAPYTPKRMLELPEQRVYQKIIQAGHLAEKLGAKILGLGAFTSVIGDAGISIARGLDIPVTTGDSYTIAIAVHTILEAGRQMGMEVSQSHTAIVGATGAIGSVCSELLADKVAVLTLIGRRPEALESLRERCEGQYAVIHTSTELDALSSANLILSMTSAISPIIEPQHLRPGAVVLDAALPHDVSRRVAVERDDVLVIEGGTVDVPGPVDFHFDFGYPPGKAYACMAETMALALEGRYEDYTLGRAIAIERVHEIDAIASRHGFRLSGLRSFDKDVTDEQIARVRERANAG